MPPPVQRERERRGHSGLRTAAPGAEALGDPRASRRSATALTRSPLLSAPHWCEAVPPCLHLLPPVCRLHLKAWARRSLGSPVPSSRIADPNSPPTSFRSRRARSRRSYQLAADGPSARILHPPLRRIPVFSSSAAWSLVANVVITASPQRGHPLIARPLRYLPIAAASSRRAGHWDSVPGGNGGRVIIALSIGVERAGEVAG